MRGIITIILFFSLVGWVQVLFLNEVWKEAQAGKPGLEGQRPVDKVARALSQQPSKNLRLPLRLLRLRSAR